MLTPILAWLDPFETPAASWAEQDWLAVLGFQMPAADGGGSILLLVARGMVNIADMKDMR